MTGFDKKITVKIEIDEDGFVVSVGKARLRTIREARGCWRGTRRHDADIAALAAELDLDPEDDVVEDLIDRLKDAAMDIQREVFP